jgi:polyferredoxin
MFALDGRRVRDVGIRSFSRREFRVAMKLERIRIGVQHASFLVLMYGGRVGLYLGSALPCFACPFVPGCGGYCYLMGFQGYIGFGMSAVMATGTGLWIALGWMLIFVLLVGLLGKLWCGWICPFGLIQDWLSALRSKLGIRERILTVQQKRRLDLVKYALLIYMIALPPLITMGILHGDFYTPFCNICPGKSLLPLFAGETRYLALNLDNGVTLALSAALVTVTGVMLAGMFFKERFFCIFCPMLAMIHMLKPITAIRLVKSPTSCVGCSNCRRACPMDIEKVYAEKLSTDVQSEECLDCGRCAESCPSDGALALKFFKVTLFSSSRLCAASRKK